MSGTMEARGILELIDLTLLDRSASEEDIASLCRVANEQGTAAVCVFPEHAQSVRDNLGEGVSLAVVAGGFPEGTESPEDISLAIAEAVSSGADEIDCVLEPRGSGDFPGQEELAKLIAMREASSGLVLKVIVETPMLGDRQIRAVARMALATGADFVKTCTGKRGPCSDEHAEILADEVSRHCISFEGSPGIKLSGGISRRGDAERLLGLVMSRDESISGAGRLRIGASSLVDDIVSGGLGRN